MAADTYNNFPCNSQGQLRTPIMGRWAQIVRLTMLRRMNSPVLLLISLLVLAHSTLTWGASNKNGDVPRGVIVDIAGPIGPAISDHVVRSIHRAESEGAALLVLRMDTPGGLDSAMRDIIRAILNADVPVASYVAPSGARAASAGTYILYASHIAAMAPATNLGAATPIPLGTPSPPSLPSPGDGESDKTDPPSDPAQRKMVNDAVAYIRSLAERRDRNADWAEKAVRSGVSLTAEKALENKVIDIVAADMQSLLAQIDGRRVELAKGTVTLSTANMSLDLLSPDWRTELLAIITNPSVAYILMMIGIYGLLLEGYNPGAIVPGVTGAICLLLALFAFQILPVNFAGLALIALGIALILAEAFVPSFGVLGLGGLAAFVFGSIMLMDTGVPGYQVPVAMIAATATAGALAIGATVYLLMRARRRAVVTGSEALIGAHAEAVEDFVTGDGEFSGRVWLAGEQWHAISDRAVTKGQHLQVTDREGLTVTVALDPQHYNS